MAKWYGKIGFITTERTGPGIDEEVVTEKKYYGDVIKRSIKTQTADQINNNIDISNQISILADHYATANFQYIRYVEWLGTLWNVESVDINYPRLTLSIGGVYHGDTSGTE